jgi:TonB family protein
VEGRRQSRRLTDVAPATAAAACDREVTVAGCAKRCLSWKKIGLPAATSGTRDAPEIPRMNDLKKITIALGLLAIGAASTPALAGSNTSRSGSVRVAAAVEPVAKTDTAVRNVPARLSRPDLDRARLVASTIQTSRGGTLTTRFRLCVTPRGSVTGIRLISSSGAPTFDRAVLDAANSWVYAGFPASADTRVCTAVSVVYRAR